MRRSVLNVKSGSRKSDSYWRVEACLKASSFVYHDAMCGLCFNLRLGQLWLRSYSGWGSRILKTTNTWCPPLRLHDPRVDHKIFCPSFNHYKGRSSFWKFPRNLRNPANSEVRSEDKVQITWNAEKTLMLRLVSYLNTSIILETVWECKIKVSQPFRKGRRKALVRRNVFSHAQAV